MTQHKKTEKTEEKKQQTRKRTPKWLQNKKVRLAIWAVVLCVWAGAMFFVAQLIVFTCAGWIISAIRDANDGVVC